MDSGKVSCSKGWSVRCARAQSSPSRCRCRCGGANHGTRFTKQSTIRVLKSSAPKKVSVVSHMEAVELWRDLFGSPVTNVPQRYISHSPTGFEWGYGGSGPADLALNILAMFIPVYWAYEYHQLFKEAFIAPMPTQGGSIPVKDIVSWIEAKFVTEKEPSGL